MGLALALAEHEARDERERRRIDRAIGSRATTSDGLALVRLWLAEAPSPGLADRIRRLAPAFRALAVLIGSAGLLLGWAAASTLLSLEGDEGRINIVVALVVLVLLPALFWLLSLLGWLVWPLRRASGRDRPTLGEWLRTGLLGGLALRVLPQSIREDVGLVLGRVTTQGRLYADVQRGQLLLWTQLLGSGFALGALLATLGFVVFTDLAFGWSTTLEIEAEPVHRIVHTMALPWAWLWPEAAPDLELVQATRFFRVASPQQAARIDPLVYGAWWRFLVMAIAVYGLLPRLVTAGVISLWLSRATTRAMDLTPGVDRLLDRLTTPFVDTRAPMAETGAGSGLQASWTPLVDLGEWWQARLREGGEPRLIRWAGVGEEDVKEAIGPFAAEAADATEAAGIGEAGGHRSLEEDAALVQESGADRAPRVVCVRGYEPPLLDLLDFLTDLRETMGPDRGLAVLLLGGRAEDVSAWRRKLASLGDPRVVVAHRESSRG